MANGTLGTSGTTTLVSINNWNQQRSINATISPFAKLVLDDINPKHPIWPGAMSRTGILYIPNRGFLKVLPGDYLGVDPNGWPILVSKNSIAGSGWTHS